MGIRSEKLEIIARLTAIEDATLIHRIKQLLDQERKHELFETTDEDLVERAKASLQSIAEGKIRNIRDFQKEIEAWKKNRTIQ